MAKLAPPSRSSRRLRRRSPTSSPGGGVLGKRAGEFDENGKKKKKEKRAPRAPTAFNLFMKKAVAEVKADQQSRQVPPEEEMNPKEIFAHCAAKWKNAPENPKSGMGSLDAGKKAKKSKK